MPTIRSRRHPLVARCRALADGRDRDDPAVLLDGLHLLADALAAELAVEVAAFTPAALARADGEGRRLAALAEARGVRIVEVAEAVMDAMSPTRSPGGVVALAVRPAESWPLAGSDLPLVVLAVGVQDPGNLGAIVRACDAAGTAGVVVAGATADPFGWKALRGAMGSAFRVPIARAPVAGEAVARLRHAGFALAATVPRDGRDFQRADLARPLVLALGGEGAGLPADLLAQADERLTVPMRPGVESLNVAVTAALVAYEARRQRLASPTVAQEAR